METHRLLFLVLLLLSSSQTEADLVNSVSECDEFFLERTPPLITGVLERPQDQTTGKDRQIMDRNRYRLICQVYKNKKRFFTLYDTRNKIPVFSAYKFTEEEKHNCTEKTKTNRRPKWRKDTNISDEYQARDRDYTNELGYDRGHLFPRSYGSTQEDKCSTFTLTNAVPQVRTFNGGSWSRMETCIKCVMNKYCINNNGKIEGFLVTGAEPGDKLLNNNNNNNNGINIPSKMWSAFCCYSKSKKKWLASAHWGDNVEENPKGKYMETKTLKEFQEQFSMIQVFPKSQCPLDTTVTEFYPELNAENNNCNCPPPTPTTTAPPTTTTPMPTDGAFVRAFRACCDLVARISSCCNNVAE